jgi:hypothetical protein
MNWERVSGMHSGAVELIMHYRAQRCAGARRGQGRRDL